MSVRYCFLIFWWHSVAASCKQTDPATQYHIPEDVHFLHLVRCARKSVLSYCELHRYIELCLNLLTHYQGAALTRLWCYISQNWLLFVPFPIPPTVDSDWWLWYHVAVVYRRTSLVNHCLTVVIVFVPFICVLCTLFSLCLKEDRDFVSWWNIYVFIFTRQYQDSTWN